MSGPTVCAHVWVEYFDGDLRCCDCDKPTNQIVIEPWAQRLIASRET